MIEYDYDKLPDLFKELELKHRVKALRGAFRKAANKVKKEAVKNLRNSGIHTSRPLEKGIRALTLKKKAGFRVTVGTKHANKNGKGERGFHTNQRGLKKPVLIWAEVGTKSRRTKTRYKFRGRTKIGHSTGQMPEYGFLGKAANSEEKTITAYLRKSIEESIIKTVKKYGNK